MNYLLRKFKMLYHFFRQKEFIMGGKFIVDEDLTLIYNDQIDKVQLNKIKNSMFENKENSKTEIKRKINRCIKYVFDFILSIMNAGTNKDNHFHGEVFFMNQTSDKSKIFSLNSKEVLTKYINEDDFIRAIELSNEISFLPTPSLYDINYVTFTYVEELIEFIPTIKWTSSTYYKIFDKYFISVTNKFASKEIISDRINLLTIGNNKCAEDFSNVFMFEKEITNIEIPCCLQHGDLWSSNILITENDILFIDFDRVRHAIFYYDFFYFLWKEYLLSDKSKPILLYFEGVYDALLLNYFSFFEESYDPELKVDYLNNYLYYSYFTEWYNADNVIKKNLHKKYNELLRIIERRFNDEDT